MHRIVVSLARIEFDAFFSIKPTIRVRRCRRRRQTSLAKSSVYTTLERNDDERKPRAVLCTPQLVIDSFLDSRFKGGACFRGFKKSIFSRIFLGRNKISDWNEIFLENDFFFSICEKFLNFSLFVEFSRFN